MENIADGVKCIIGHNNLDFTMYLDKSLENSDIFNNRKILDLMYDIRKDNNHLSNCSVIFSQWDEIDFENLLERILDENTNYFNLSKDERSNTLAKYGIIRN